MRVIILIYKFRDITIFFHPTWLLSGRRAGVTRRLCDVLYSSFSLVKPPLWDEGNKDWGTGAAFYSFYPLLLLLKIRKYTEMALEQKNSIKGGELEPNLSMSPLQEASVLSIISHGLRSLKRVRQLSGMCTWKIRKHSQEEAYLWWQEGLQRIDALWCLPSHPLLYKLTSLLFPS